MSALADVRGWLERWNELVPWPDRVALVTPPLLVGKLAHYAMRLHKRREAADDLGARDPRFVSLFVDLARALGRSYFRLRVEGVDNIPERGGALLVGNHNGGLVTLEPFFTATAVWDRHGSHRALHTLGHDFLFDDPLFRRYATKLGVLRAGHAGARRALDDGRLVLVYPGGDLDTFRAFRDRAKIELGGRTGFVKLALRSRVPIVPVVTTGAHEQFVVLTRGDRIAKLLHLHAWARVAVFPIVFAIPWGVTTGFVPYLPLPTQTTITFGEPMTWPGLGPDAAEDPATVSRVYDEVRARMQSILEHESRGRRLLFGRRSRPRDVRDDAQALRCPRKERFTVNTSRSST